MAQQFSTGATDVRSSSDLAAHNAAPSELQQAGQKAIAALIDSKVLGEGPYSVNVSGSFDDRPGAQSQLTITISATTPMPTVPVPVPVPVIA